MRTTVEIRADQHEALAAIAQRRKLRGFSALVQEALDAYLHDLRGEEIDLLLGLEGVIDDADANQLASRIEETRALWRAS